MNENPVYRYASCPEQLYGVRRVTAMEGGAKGCDLLEAYTSGGLQADFLPDTGLDIGLVRFKGVNVSFLTKNGYDSPESNLPYEHEFVHSFPGGLLYTCGLRSTGPANRDGEEWFPLHGRYHGLRAENQGAYVEDGQIVIRGTVRETALFGHALVLSRRITLPVDGSSITVEDAITNHAPRPEAFMLLYHVNFGYPLLSEHAKLLLPEPRTTTPRTPFAKAGLHKVTTFDPPTDGEEERCYFHEMDESQVTLANPAIGIRATLSWSKETLPLLVHWRSMASGDYALGLEPSNSYIMGRNAERANGTLPVLQPNETVHTRVTIAFASL